MVPAFSVCIPTLGRPSLVDRALPSVLAAPEAARGAVEVVVGIDPAVTTLELPADLAERVRVVEVPWTTPGAVRNTLAAATTGEALVFLDDDDALAPGWCAIYADLLAAGDAAVACGAVRRVWPDGTEELLDLIPLTPLHCGWVGRFNAGSFAVRRPMWDAVGGFDEVLPSSENWELSMRLAQESERQGLCLAATHEVVLDYLWGGDEDKYRLGQAAVAARMLEVHADRLARDPAARAGYLAQLGVGEARIGNLRRARRAFWSALRCQPGDRSHWVRLGVSAVPPLARRRWALSEVGSTGPG